jgi:16S rRNA (adenine1518-N6/adenine1519-N6)-dimethyltransferase
MNLTSPAAARELLQRHSFLPAHKHGQNFLVDGNTLAKIVAAGKLSTGDTVLEVGTGLGVLTRALADAVGPSGHVITIERDSRLFPIHEDTLPKTEYPQVTVILGDALTVDIDSAISSATGADGTPVSVVANIPYNITSPLIARLLEECKTRFNVIVMLVQREVALRLAARAGSAEYGAFSVFAQYHASVDMVGLVPPTVFFPKPKVTSAIVRLTPHAVPPYRDCDRELLFKIVHASFQQRRKTIHNALASDTTGWNKDESLSVLKYANIDPMRRGETLSLDEFARLSQAAKSVVVR